MAVCRAATAYYSLPLFAYIRNLTEGSNQNLNNDKFILPCPAFNVINGGKHGGN